jgi:hypothetical protein
VTEWHKILLMFVDSPESPYESLFMCVCITEINYDTVITKLIIYTFGLSQKGPLKGLYPGTV